MSKYIKPYLKTIILVIGLIILQANAELSLPEYMSNIVNIGIAQSGVEYAAPLAIEESEMRAYFAEEEGIYEYYALFQKGENVEIGKSAIVLKENTYVLMDSSKTVMETVQEYFLSTFGGESNARAMVINRIVASYNEMGIDLSSIQTSYIFKTGGQMVLLAIVSSCFAILVSFLITRVGAGFSRDLRKAVFSKVMSFSNQEFDKFSTASLITRSTNDVQQLQMFVNMSRIVVFAPTMGLGAIYKIVKTESSLTGILAVAIACIVVLVIGLFAATSKKFKLVQELTDNANRTVRESLSGLLVIRAFSNQKESENRFDSVNADLSRTNRFITRTMGAMNPIMGLLMNVSIVAIVYFGAKFVESGIIQVGSIMAFVQYSTHVIMSFMFISMISVFMPRAIVSINRIREVLNSETSITEKEKPMDFEKGKKGMVEFKNVSFKYSDADEYILNDINFTANPGETTAIIGTTGSGKSTIINLIPRLYDATEGEVLVDGSNIKNVKIKDLRKKISYAPQKGILFSGTIESNIKFAGYDLVSDEDMEKYAQIAQASDFIKDKEEHFDSPISQGGTNVSGGQRQRLSIARALAKPAEILIFDDSFSALDYKTDANLRKALEENLGDKTIIIVAQRIATIRNAEKILVMDEGRIVGQGKHDYLMESCEVYRQIASSQLGIGGAN